MITPGWMPSYRGRAARGRLAYVRVRGRKQRRRAADAPRRAPSPLHSPSIDALPLEMFAPSTAELPRARVRLRRTTVAGVGAELLAWLAAQVRWMRPRAIPAAIAVLGLLALTGLSSYLARPDASLAGSTLGPTEALRAYAPAASGTAPHAFVTSALR